MIYRYSYFAFYIQIQNILHFNSIRYFIHLTTCNKYTRLFTL